MVLRMLFLIVSLLPAFAGASTQWPNEPAGSTPVVDDPLSQLNSNGWTCYCADVSVFSDPSAPLSGPSVAQYRYATGFQAGISPGNNYHSLPNLKEIYYGFWWKPSNPWQNENMSNVNKITFLMSGDMNVIQTMYWSGSSYFLLTGLQPSGTAASLDNCHLPNSYGAPGECGPRGLLPQNGGGTITLGVWHRIETYIKHSTTMTSRDGVIRVWLNGTLIVNHTNANLTARPWNQFELNPTWGGLNNTKTQTDYYYYDHIHISAPHGDGGYVPSPSITTAANLPSAVNGRPYLAALQANGGKSPYKWLITSGSLFTGLRLDSASGVISGTPTSVTVKCSFTAKVRDSSTPAQEATKSFYILPATAISTQQNGSSQIAGIRIQASAGKVGFHLPLGAVSQFSVYDLAGKKMFEKKGVGAKSESQFKVNLRNGIYFARFVIGEQVSTIQFHVLN